MVVVHQVHYTVYNVQYACHVSRLVASALTVDLIRLDPNTRKYCHLILKTGTKEKVGRLQSAIEGHLSLEVAMSTGLCSNFYSSSNNYYTSIKVVDVQFQYTIQCTIYNTVTSQS